MGEFDVSIVRHDFLVRQRWLDDNIAVLKVPNAIGSSLQTCNSEYIDNELGFIKGLGINDEFCFLLPDFRIIVFKG